MSDLRRRIFGVGTPESTPDSSRDVSPAPGLRKDGEKQGEDYTIIPARKLEKLKKHVHKSGGRKRRNFWMFGLGGLFGVLVAGFFASSNGGLDRLAEVTGLQDLNLDSLFDVLPAGLIKDVQDLQVRPP